MPDELPPVVQAIAQFASSEVERLMKRAVLCCCLFVALLGAAVPLPAQAPAASPSSPQSSPEASKESNDRLAQLERRVAAAQSAGDNAWMLTSAALVLMMTGPGLALFYGGLVQEEHAGHHDAEL